MQIEQKETLTENDLHEVFKRTSAFSLKSALKEEINIELDSDKENVDELREFNDEDDFVGDEDSCSDEEMDDFEDEDEGPRRPKNF